MEVQKSGIIGNQSGVKKSNITIPLKNQNTSFQGYHIADALASKEMTEATRAIFSANVKPAAKMQVISFAGKNLDQRAFVGAEIKGFDVKGGVGTVMGDYMTVWKEGSCAFIPYYNGKLTYDANGEPTGEVSVLMKDGKPIYTPKNLDEVKVQDLTDGQYFELEKVADKDMEWAGQPDKVTLYKVKDKNVYMVYTDATAKMPRPYEDGASYAYSSSGKTTVNKNLGNPYAKFGKAYVELVPALEAQGFNPAHHVLSDSQAAYVPEYMAQKVFEDNEYYKSLDENITKSSYVGHNINPGYQGETSAQNMFYSLAPKKVVEALDHDPEYIQALKDGTTEKYFEQFIPQLIDEKKSVNPSMIPINYSEQGYVVRIDGVSEGYMEDVANNPKVAPGLTGHIKKGMEDGRIGGILNGHSGAGFRANEEIGLELYNKVATDEKTGITHQPLKIYNKDMSIQEILTIRNENKLNLLQRFIEGANPEYAMGIKGKKCDLKGYIDKEWIDKLKNGEEIPLIDSWGRADFQKGHDITIKAFKKFIQTEEGKNAVLILGGELLEGSEEAQKILKEMEDPILRGRAVFMDGFAPGAALARAGDSNFASRFAPCELTDLEAMLCGSTPSVTNTQGMGQKNPDPRKDGLEKATSYKTDNPFYMTDEQLTEKSTKFKEGMEKLLKAEKKKLEIRGVAADKIETLASENVSKSKKYENLYRECADDVLVDEFAEAMKAKQTASLEIKETLIKNGMNAKIGWDNNNALHPSGKSSKQMYEELHFNRKGKLPTKSMFEVPQAFWDRITRAKEQFQKNSSDLGEKAQKALEEMDKSIKGVAENVERSSNKLLKTGAVIAFAVLGGSLIQAFSGKKAVIASESSQNSQANPAASLNKGKEIIKNFSV